MPIVITRMVNNYQSRREVNMDTMLLIPVIVQRLTLNYLGCDCYELVLWTITGYFRSNSTLPNSNILIAVTVWSCAYV